jgi:predicted Fe-Mo cluster-binding NifX family protein
MIKKTAALFSLSLLFVLPSLVGQEKQTKRIAIASEGDTIDSSVCERAARCKYFLIFDNEGHMTEALDNPYRDELFDVGPKTSDYLAKKEVRLFVAGKIGARLMEALQAKGIAHLEFSGTVENALEHALEEREQKKAS